MIPIADALISALSAATVLDTVDEFVVVDKSDTTMAASGTTKRLPLSTLMADPIFIASMREPRNLLDNGAINVCQRATSVAGLTVSGWYTADRWGTGFVALGTWTQSQATDGPASTEFKKSLKMACTTADAAPAAGDFAYMYQAIEGQFLQHLLKGTASAKQLSLSFWVKSTTTGTYIAELGDNDNNRFVSAAYTISVANTWEYKTMTFPADTSGVLDNDANGSFILIFWLACGTTYDSGTLGTTWHTSVSTNRAKGQVNLAALNTNTWQITGVQLEVGSVVTPFETRKLDDELRSVKRYLEVPYDYQATASSISSFVQGVGVSGGSLECRYNRSGKWVDVWFIGTVSSAGTAGSAFTVTLANVPLPRQNFNACGTFEYEDQGTSYYVGVCHITTSLAVTFSVYGNAGNKLGGFPNFACANTDVIQATLRYETNGPVDI